MSLQAIDISSNNSYVDVTQVQAPIIINKLTGGISYTWQSNLIRKSLECSKLVGAYHFEDEYNKHVTIETQARYFYSQIKPFLGHVLPILDYEKPLNNVYFNHNDINRIERFMKEFKRLSGINCVLYCSKDLVWNNIITPYLKQTTMLWFAQYPNYNPTSYQSQPWTDTHQLDMNLVGQQYTSNGRVAGVTGPVDLSIFYITAINWNKSCQPSK